jgi:hypothetical protein
MLHRSTTAAAAAEISLRAGDLHDAFARTRHAIYKEQTRYYLNGGRCGLAEGRVGASRPSRDRPIAGAGPPPEPPWAAARRTPRLSNALFLGCYFSQPSQISRANRTQYLQLSQVVGS